ncbi:MAG: hypothetical protein HY000_16605 [Planctomycetes bacterium]|nr:hypothetical protein [Planctomycetota bacterium]
MVTQNGQPIEHATISFTPSKETKGPKAGSAIKDGWYRIEADQGLRQGQYVVTVSLTTAPSRRQVMVEKSKWSQKSYDFQRAITGENAQIDIDL